MPVFKHRRFFFLFLSILLVFAVSSACVSVSGTETPGAPAVQTETNIAEPPTPMPTREPMALSINGQGVTVAEYETQKQQIISAAAATGQALTDAEIDEMLKEYFVQFELLAQAAYAAGYNPDEQELQARLQELITQAGGDEAFQSWLRAAGTTPEVFQITFRRELAAEWQRTQLAAAVGETAEQIHARQILVITREKADEILSQLRGGSDFGELAALYDTITKGDLGWFPRGTLFLPAVEETLFALQPGQFTDVIESEYGFHIILVEEREQNHPLSDTARLDLQHEAVEAWLSAQEAAAVVEILH